MASVWKLFVAYATTLIIGNASADYMDVDIDGNIHSKTKKFGFLVTPGDARVHEWEWENKKCTFSYLVPEGDQQWWRITFWAGLSYQSRRIWGCVIEKTENQTALVFTQFKVYAKGMIAEGARVVNDNDKTSIIDYLLDLEKNLVYGDEKFHQEFNMASIYGLQTQQHTEL